MADRQTGTVKWFDAKKGYGFISTDNGEDIFVHYTAIQTEGFKVLEESQKVEFTVVDGNKGPVASDLVPIS